MRIDQPILSGTTAAVRKTRSCWPATSLMMGAAIGSAPSFGLPEPAGGIFTRGETPPPLADAARRDFHLKSADATITGAGLPWSKITLPKLPASSNPRPRRRLINTSRRSLSKNAPPSTPTPKATSAPLVLMAKPAGREDGCRESGYRRAPLPRRLQLARTGQCVGADPRGGDSVAYASGSLQNT